jgi:hypothetical protein
MMPRLIAVGVAALATVLLVGVIVVRAGSGGAEPDAESELITLIPDSPATASSDSDSRSAELWSGWVDDAQRAAADVVSRTGEVVAAGFISRRELVETFTTPSFGPTFADETGRAIDAMLVELGSRQADAANVVVREQPISSTAVATTNGVVVVRVWSVLIVAAPGAGPGRQAWRTVTLDMVQRNGVWLVDGWASAPGPTPSPPAGGVVDSAEAVAVPLSWDPVGAG